MRQAAHHLEIGTRGPGLTEITEEARAFLGRTGLETGLLTLYVPHTSASLLIQENADPDVIGDLLAFYSRLAPWSARDYVHDTEGPDDMPAHIRASLTQTSLGVPVLGRALALGRWQGIYLFEHRAAPHRRTVLLHAIGE